MIKLKLVLAFVLSIVSASAMAQTFPGLLGPGQIVGNYGSGSALAAPSNWMPAGSACPTWLSPFSLFTNSAGGPTSDLLTIWDGSQCVTIGTLNATAHTFNPSGSASNITVGTTGVLSGTPNGLLYNNAGILGNLATANNSVLATNGSGVPSLVTTLPSGLTAPSLTVTTAFTATGLVTNADLANASVTLGSTALVLGTSTSTIAGAITWSGAQTHTSTTLFSGGVPSLVNGNAAVGASSTAGGILIGQGSTSDLTLENKSGASVCAVPTGTTTLGCATLTLTNPLTIANGGTGAITQQAALNAIAPTPTRAGDIIYYNGTNWINLAGNNSGTQVLQETSSGVPSWTTAGAGTVTSLTCAATLTCTASNPITSTGTITLALGNANTWTGVQTLDTPVLVFGSGSASNISASSTNTGFGNALVIANGGTVSSIGTIAQLSLQLTNGSNVFVNTSIIGGAAPSATLQSGSGATGGFTISAGAGLLALASPNLTGTVEVGGFAMTFPSASAILTQTIASGALTLNTTLIASGACSAAQTATATGAATTDASEYFFNADPTSTTGYAPTTNGMLTIITYVTSNTFNAKVCNNTGASITPGAVTINWRIVR